MVVVTHEMDFARKVSCTLARKAGGFEFRQDDAQAKGFATKYYNAGIHHGALSTPAFVAQALGE